MKTWHIRVWCSGLGLRRLRIYPQVEAETLKDAVAAAINLAQLDEPKADSFEAFEFGWDAVGFYRQTS